MSTDKKGDAITVTDNKGKKKGELNLCVNIIELLIFITNIHFTLF